MIYGYSRVSSVGQEQKGNSLKDQEDALRAAGASVVFSDTFTGKTMQRPEFMKLLEALRAGDTLICTKLDRFSRTAAEGAQTVQELLEKGVTIDILNMGRIDNSPMGKLLVNVLLAFAEFERSQIVERTQAGRKIAMANGAVMGRPQKYNPQRLGYALDLLAAGNSYKKVEAMTGISKSTLIRNRRLSTAVK